MRLFHSATSPFSRKVLVTASELGIALDLVTVATLPTRANADLKQVNPLAQIPVLVTDDGETLYDSRVICEYLDADGRLTPRSGARRWTALRQQALADGVTDAAVLIRYETFLRPAELRWTDWITGQQAKIVAGLDELERDPPLGDRVDLGAISVACALSYIELRSPVDDPRERCPKLYAWYASFRTRPSMTNSELG
jgi:glutathione S-transferase